MTKGQANCILDIFEAQKLQFVWGWVHVIDVSKELEMISCNDHSVFRGNWEVIKIREANMSEDVGLGSSPGMESFSHHNCRAKENSCLLLLPSPVPQLPLRALSACCTVCK